MKDLERLVDNVIIEVHCEWGYISRGGAEADCVGVGEVVCRWAPIGWCCRSHVYVCREKI